MYVYNQYIAIYCCRCLDLHYLPEVIFFVCSIYSGSKALSKLVSYHMIRTKNKSMMCCSYFVLLFMMMGYKWVWTKCMKFLSADTHIPRISESFHCSSDDTEGLLIRRGMSTTCIWNQYTWLHCNDASNQYFSGHYRFLATEPSFFSFA